MSILKHIYENSNGITCFDRYFEYLRGIEGAMPKPLSAFALDTQRYDLNSATTLHDSWLISLNLNKCYNHDRVSTSVKLDLMLATHKKVLTLLYSGIEDLHGNYRPNRWTERPVDLLVHEFCMLDDGKFKHSLQFDREVWLQLVFSDFSFHELPL